MKRATPSSGRGVVTLERVTVWGLAILAVAALAGLAVGPGADLRTDAPSITVESEFDAETGTVTLAHAGGDRLTGTATRDLTVVVTDASAERATTLTWASADDLPLGEGAQFVVDDPRVDADGDGDYLDGDASVGFYLESGDTVQVVWTGRLLGAPDQQTTTIATVTL